MTNSASLAGNAAADNANHDVELILNAGHSQGAADDQLQGLQTKVLVNVTIVDGDLAGAVVNANAGNGALTTTGAVEIRFSLVHFSLPPYQNSTVSGFWAAFLCSAPL